METEPEGTAKKYIFLVDNQDIAMNIVLSDYQALYLAEEDDEHYFSVESFIDDINRPLKRWIRHSRNRKKQRNRQSRQ